MSFTEWSSAEISTQSTATQMENIHCCHLLKCARTLVKHSTNYITTNIILNVNKVHNCSVGTNMLLKCCLVYLCWSLLYFNLKVWNTVHLETLYSFRGIEGGSISISDLACWNIYYRQKGRINNTYMGSNIILGGV